MTSLPTLVVVSGPIAAGKTTLAHQLARAIGCPAICRVNTSDGCRPGLDEIVRFVTAPGPSRSSP